MKLKQIRIQNYRNLSNITLVWDPLINYLIGENNVGKSNCMDALDQCFGRKPVADEDYRNPQKPIRMEMELMLHPSEAARWHLPAGKTLLLSCQRWKNDPHTHCKNMRTQQVISDDILSYINFFRNGVIEKQGERQRLNLEAFLTHLIERHMQSQQIHLPDDEMQGLLQWINQMLGRIKVFSDFGLQARLPAEESQMLSSLIHVMDDSRQPLQHSGRGVQYSIMAMMNVVNRILDLFHSQSQPLADMVYVTEEGKKILPMLLALDEPEAHLHPYLQRSMIRYYKRIASNQDENFLELLKICFDLDGLDGQLMVITHSTDALVDNFRNLIRFYKNPKGHTQAACGNSLNIRPDIEKHLIMQFPDIKEAFYARCAILVEGITESCSLRLFADTMHVFLDDYGICVIDGGGEGALRKMQSLLRQFGIPCVLVFDGDVRRTKSVPQNEFYTRTLCFETEMVESLVEAGQSDLLERMVEQLEPGAKAKRLSFAYLEKPLQKFDAIDLPLPQNLAALRADDTARYKTLYAAWLFRNKGAILGRVMGEGLPEDCIPACYRDAILYARDIATGAQPRGSAPAGGESP